MGNNKIDWSEVHHRLDAAQIGLERSLAPSSEEKKRILKKRAKALARGPETEEGGGERR